MSINVCPITPETKLGEMLECYPALEELLIGISPTCQSKVSGKSADSICDLGRGKLPGGMQSQIASGFHFENEDR